MKLIDTHAHLNVTAFDQDRRSVLEGAWEAGVRRLINVGYDLPSSAASIELAQCYPQIFATAGIQPHYAAATGAAELQQLRQLLAHPKVVSLGEIGLDYHHDRAPRDAQRALFEAQLAIAAETELPAVIHSRDAWSDTV